MPRCSQIGNNREAGATFSHRCRIDDADNFYAAIAGAECGDLGKLPGAVEGNPSPSVRRALPQDFRGILAGTTKELNDTVKYSAVNLLFSANPCGVR